MATITQVDTVNVTINGTEIAVPKGELVVEAAKRLGLDIPIFCYHPRMKPVGMCRMCLVETGMKQPDGTIRMMPKPAAACTMPVSEGLVIVTESEALHRDRKGVLEFLLANHPLDCPICDRGGECPLQNNTLFYGPSTSRFIEMKRHAPKAFPLSDYVVLDLERCIQCARCVRFTEEISGDGQLAFRFRGANTQPVTFGLTKFTSKFSGNVIEICPVGALTSSNYRFRARPWDLQSSPSVCTRCSNGCSVWFDNRRGKFVRINGRTNESINEEWTCDKGKFGHEFYNSDRRLGQVFARNAAELSASSWSDALSQVFAKFAGGGSDVGMIVSPENSNETLHFAKRFMVEVAKSPNLDYRVSEHPVGDCSVQNSIESLESAKSILIFGCSLADDLPIIYLRCRKACTQRSVPVAVVSSVETDADEFSTMSVRCRPGTESKIAAALAELASGGTIDLDRICDETDVNRTEFESLRAIANGATIVTSTGIFESGSGVAMSASLARLAQTSGGQFNCYATKSNERGAEIMRIGGGMSGFGMLGSAAAGQLSALWIIGTEVLDSAPKEMVEAALENLDFLVIQDSKRNEAFYYASVALPATLPAESDGTFTNCEGRVQLVKQAIPPVEDARPAWKVLESLCHRVKSGPASLGVQDVLAQIPEFSGISWDAVAGAGAIIR